MPLLVAATLAIIPGAITCWRSGSGCCSIPGKTVGVSPTLSPWGSVPGDYCLIEVKGPGDALQDSQKRWLRFFAQQGIPAAVAWVSWEIPAEIHGKTAGTMPAMLELAVSVGDLVAFCHRAGISITASRPPPPANRAWRGTSGCTGAGATAIAASTRWSIAT